MKVLDDIRQDISLMDNVSRSDQIAVTSKNAAEETRGNFVPLDNLYSCQLKTKKVFSLKNARIALFASYP